MRHEARQVPSWLIFDVSQGMNFRVLLPFALSLLAPSVFAQAGAHLVPVEGYFSSHNFQHSYLTVVRDLLVRDAIDSPAAMITLPSFTSERIVYLQSRSGKTFVVSATASKQIWSSEKREAISVSQKSQPISPESAQKIVATFALATSQVRYPKEAVLGLDGVNYYFSTFAKGIGIRAGHTWSPPAGSPCSLLVQLGDLLHRYAGGGVPEATVEAAANALLVALKKNG